MPSRGTGHLRWSEGLGSVTGQLSDLGQATDLPSYSFRICRVGTGLYAGAASSTAGLSLYDLVCYWTLYLCIGFTSVNNKQLSGNNLCNAT